MRLRPARCRRHFIEPVLLVQRPIGIHAISGASASHLVPFAEVGPHPLLHMASEMEQGLGAVAVMKIPYPSAEGFVDVPHHHREGQACLPPLGQLRNAVFDPLQGLLRRLNVGIGLARPFASSYPEFKPQKREALLSGIHDAGLGVVQGESQSFHDVTHDEHRLLRPSPAQYDTVIGVPYQPGLQLPLELAPLPYPVQDVQVQVGQERRDHAALWGSLGVSLPAAPVSSPSLLVLFPDRSLEPHPDEVQDAPIRDALGEHSQEFRMGNGVEVLRDIGVNDGGVPAQRVRCIIHGIVGRPFGSEPVGGVAEVCFKDRLDDQLHGHLGDSVPDGRDAQGAFGAVSLGNPDPFDRAWCIGLAPQCFLELRHKSGRAFLILDGFEGDAIDPGAAFVGPDQILGMTEDVCPIDLVVEGVEAVGRLLLGLTVELPLERPDVFRG